MSFKPSTNFLLLCVRKLAKYGGFSSIGLDAAPTVQIHICHPVLQHYLGATLLVNFNFKNVILFAHESIEELVPSKE